VFYVSLCCAKKFTPKKAVGAFKRLPLGISLGAHHQFFKMIGDFFVILKKEFRAFLGVQYSLLLHLTP